MQSVGIFIPLENIQPVGILSTQYSASRNVLVKNIQSPEQGMYWSSKKVSRNIPAQNISRNIPVQNISKCTNYGVSRNIPVQNASNQQGYLSTNYAVSRDIPVQNVSNQQDYFEYKLCSQ